MPVTDEMVAAFRAHLTGDREEWDRRNDALERSPATERAYFAFLTGLFATAVGRRFDEKTQREEIIAFVAHLRARDDVAAERLDPDATERVISMIFHDDVETADIPRRQSIDIRMAVLTAIVRDDDLDSAELEAFLQEAKDFADAMLG